MKNHKNQSRAHLRLASLCVLLASVTLVLSGCEMLGLSDPGQPNPSTSGDDAARKKAPPRKAPPKTLAQTGAASEEEEKPYERPEFKNTAARNPFAVSPEVVMPSGIETVEEDRPMEPLEEFSLAQLSLVGVISETAVPKAMFVDSEGFGHVVKEGDRIGRQGGIITDIRNNEVDVQEGAPESATTSGSLRTLRLSDTELRATAEENELSDAERQALDRLMKSEEGREMLLENLRVQANQPGAQGGQGQGAGAGIAPPSAR